MGMDCLSLTTLTRSSQIRLFCDNNSLFDLSFLKVLLMRCSQTGGKCTVPISMHETAPSSSPTPPCYEAIKHGHTGYENSPSISRGGKSATGDKHR